ncbi:hypothetical protein DMUE_2098 [Dictyocoela muelleri]|nr:hypothetical protein DMUE_2098 [Dictyocoela muelleri]
MRNNYKLNKKNSQSIYSHYLSSGSIPMDHSILSSNINSLEKVLRELLNEQQSCNQLFGIYNRYDTISFDVMSANSNLKFTHKMNILKSITEQDILKWISIFKETASFAIDI